LVLAIRNAWRLDPVEVDIGSTADARQSLVVCVPSKPDGGRQVRGIARAVIPFLILVEEGGARVEEERGDIVWTEVLVRSAHHVLEPRLTHVIG
jgi:hypothetical protein